MDMYLLWSTQFNGTDTLFKMREATQRKQSKNTSVFSGERAEKVTVGSDDTFRENDPIPLVQYLHKRRVNKVKDINRERCKGS